MSFDNAEVGKRAISQLGMALFPLTSKGNCGTSPISCELFPNFALNFVEKPWRDGLLAP